MFISLHADSNPRREARGFSVYSLSETASDAESAALAEQENKVDILGGMEVDVDDPEVADILIDLTQRETMSKSGDLAEILVGEMHPKVTQLSKTHRYAGFRVLIPSVLIEIGFLSNPIDERLLASPEFRELVVASLIKGIDRYFEKKGG
jgi:N-acetylmuramoyl-L-alanine amidase